METDRDRNKYVSSRIDDKKCSYNKMVYPTPYGL